MNEDLWLGNRDSNPNKQSQSLSCYRYTIPQYQTPNRFSLTCESILYTLSVPLSTFFQKFFAWDESFLF